MKSKELYQLTSEIAMFLEDLAEDADLEDLDDESVKSLPEMSYADAILNWRQDQMNAYSFFSTDSKLLLKFKDQLTEKYGLPILSKEEGQIREIELRKEMEVRRMKTKTFLN